MSNLIKASHISFGKEVYKVSSNITITNTQYIENLEENMKFAKQDLIDNFEFQTFDENFEDEDVEFSEFNDENISLFATENIKSDDIRIINNKADKIIEEAHNEAEQIILSSKETAIKIEDEALQKANEIYETNREKGYDDGFSYGMEQAQSQANSIIDEALQIKNDNMNYKQNLIKSLEEEVLELALEISKKILNREMKNDEYIENIVKLGVSKLIVTSKIIIRVSSEDYKFVDSIKNKIYAMAEKIDEIEIKEDFSLQKGDCVVENESSGSIDVGIQTQMIKIEDELKSYLRF